MAESGMEKTEEATPRRREEARKKGSVAKSVDLTNALVMLSMLFILPTAIGMMGAGFMQLIKVSLYRFPTEANFEVVGLYLRNCLQLVLPGLFMIMGMATVVGVGANVAQVGVKFTPQVVAPSFSKINPATGLKRMFSVSSMFDGVKATLKTFIFLYLAYSAIAANWNSVGNMGNMSPVGGLQITGQIIRSIATKVIGCWAFIAAADYVFQKFQHNKSLKMTKDEVKREYKDAESSPEMKGARMRMARKNKARLREAVQSATVIVTNPTHYSVAIYYEPGQPAPIVVAKGVDHLAFKIREFAKEFDVPIVPNPPLARALYKQVEVGDPVPRELFQSVAELLAYVFKTIRKLRGLEE